MGQVDDGFYAAVLQAIAAPATPNTLQLCRDWQRFEGGSAAWNPWNTTQWAVGATVYNSAGVKNYPDEATGEHATAATLTNGYYPDVLAALQHDLPAYEWGLNPAITDQIDTWGTHGFAAYLRGIATPPSPLTGGHDSVNTVVIHITDAGGQYVVDGDGSAYPANGTYADAIPMTAADYNTFVAGRQAFVSRLLTALSTRS